MSTTTAAIPFFTERTFTQPTARLLKLSAKTKGSYTFEVFAYEGKALRYFNVRFLPNRPYYAMNFMSPHSEIAKDDEDVLIASNIIENIISKHRKDWQGKISINELTYNFIHLLIDSQSIKVPDAIQKAIAGEIQRIFLHPSIVLQDKKGRPYFSNARFGKFWITDLGTVTKEDYAALGLTIN